MSLRRFEQSRERWAALKNCRAWELLSFTYFKSCFGMLDFRAFNSLGNMPSLINHDSSLEFDDHGSILFEARRFEAHNSDIGSGLRLPLLENLTLRIQSISIKERIRKTHFIPAQIGDRILRNVGNRLACHDRERECRVNERPAEFRFRCIGMIEVNRIGVHGQQGKPNIVGGKNCAAQSVAKNISNLEVLKNSSSPTLFDCHREPFLDSRRGNWPANPFSRSIGNYCGLAGSLSFRVTSDHEFAGRSRCAVLMNCSRFSVLLK